MRDFLREHSWAVVVSVLLHGLLVGGLILTAFMSSFRKPPDLQPLPIDAVVVDSQVLHAAQHAQEQRAAEAAASAQAAEQARAAAADAKVAEEAKAAEDAKAAEEAKAAEQAKAAAAAEDAAKAAAAEQQHL